MAPVSSSAREARRATARAGPLAGPGRWREPDGKGGFDGARVHAVQIGLGTFATVIQNLAGGSDEWDAVISWLLEATSEQRPEHFRSVSVEPVSEHVAKLRKLLAALPHSRLVQAAIGDQEAEGVELQTLTQAAHDRFLASVSPSQRSALESDLVYLRNMSCVGGPHPTFDLVRRNAWNNHRVDLQLESIHTDVWSYSKLADDLDFCGCEVLIVDAEGHDAKILRSMICHCEEQEALGRSAWPDIVVFESAGICDEKEGLAAESQVTKQLEGHGYIVVLQCKMNTDMIRRQAMESSERLQRWVADITCHGCWRAGALPFKMQGGQMLCANCVSASPNK